MLLTTSLSLLAMAGKCKGRGEGVQLEVGGLDAACNRGDCIASVFRSVASVSQIELSWQLQSYFVCSGNGCATRRMSDLFRIRSVCCAVQLI